MVALRGAKVRSPHKVNRVFGFFFALRTPKDDLENLHASAYAEQ
jgi:hypothetical protein